MLLSKSLMISWLASLLSFSYSKCQNGSFQLDVLSAFMFNNRSDDESKINLSYLLVNRNMPIICIKITVSGSKKEVLKWENCVVCTESFHALFFLKIHASYWDLPLVMFLSVSRIFALQLIILPMIINHFLFYPHCCAYLCRKGWKWVFKN